MSSIDSGCSDSDLIFDRHLDELDKRFHKMPRDPPQYLIKRAFFSPEEAQKQREEFINLSQKAYQELDDVERFRKISGNNRAESERRGRKPEQEFRKHGRGRRQHKFRSSGFGDRGVRCADSTRRTRRLGKQGESVDENRSNEPKKTTSEEESEMGEVRRSRSDSGAEKWEDLASPPAAGELDAEASASAHDWRRESNGSDDSGIAGSPVMRTGFAALIDEDVRQRLANPTRRVFIDDSCVPKDNIVFIDIARQREAVERAQSRVVEECHDSEDDQAWIVSYDGTLYEPDDICSSYMRWGCCPKGRNCPQRHPECRYPCPPSEER